MTATIIFDTETASLQGGVVELAWLVIDHNLTVLEQQVHRINPQRPIDPGAFAVHGISDADVANCPTLLEVTDKIPQPCRAIGHNVSFDQRMVGSAIVIKESLCTLELSRRYVGTGTSNHKLGTLIEELGLPTRQFHSALDDCLAVRDLLELLISRLGVELDTLFQRSKQPSALHKMPFGKHKDQYIWNVPASYRNWLLRQDIDQDVRYTLTRMKGIK